MRFQRFWVSLSIATVAVSTLATDASAGRRHHRGRSCAPVVAAPSVSNCGCNGSYSSYGQMSNVPMGQTWSNGNQYSNGSMGYSGYQSQPMIAGGYYSGAHSATGAVQANAALNANNYTPSVYGSTNANGNWTLNGNTSGSVNGNVDRNMPQNGDVQGNVNGSLSPTSQDGNVQGDVNGSINPASQDGNVRGNVNGSFNPTSQDGNVRGNVNGSINPTQSNADASLNGSVQPSGGSAIPATDANISGQLNQATDIIPNR